VLLNTLIAALLMVVTRGVHASGMHLVMNGVRRYQQNQTKNPLRPTNMYRIGGTVLLMFLVSLVQVMIWASTYLALNAIEVLSGHSTSRWSPSPHWDTEKLFSMNTGVCLPVPGEILIQAAAGS
jgi:hypothetical protein